MDEGEREDGPDRPVPEDGEPRSEEPRSEWPAPALLQELATGEVTDDRAAGAAEEPIDEDDAVATKPRVRTSTKVVLVAGAWLLLTLFLVGRFSGGPSPERSTRLDQATSDREDEATHDGEDGAGEVEAGGGAAGEGVTGEYADGAATYRESTGAGAGTGGVAGGGSGVYAGVPADGSGGVGGGDAVPGAAPGTPGTATSPAPAPGSGGGSATTAPPSGGSTASTATTAPPAGGRGGGGTTTTAATPPPGASPVDRTITISGHGKYAYDTPNLTLPSGSRVRVSNGTNVFHDWKIDDETPIAVPRGQTSGYRSFTSTVSFRCTVHEELRGTVTIT